jgi:hypothetical protein
MGDWLYALYFSGNDEHDPSWLKNRDGDVIVFRVRAVADTVRGKLYSGDEEITVSKYAGDLPTAPSKFEERYLKDWRYGSNGK